MSDPIVNEVRAHREEILKSHGSIRRYHEAVMEEQAQYGDRLVVDGSQYAMPKSKNEDSIDNPADR